MFSGRKTRSFLPPARRMFRASTRRGAAEEISFRSDHPDVGTTPFVRLSGKNSILTASAAVGSERRRAAWTRASTTSSIVRSNLAATVSARRRSSSPVSWSASSRSLRFRRILAASASRVPVYSVWRSM